VPTSLEVGYFVRGGMGLSSGTRASTAGMVAAPSFAWRNGRIGSGRRHVATFDVGGQRLDGLPIGGSEHFALPRLDRRIDDVGVYLGWAGQWTRAANALGTGLALTAKVPGVARLLEAGLTRATGSATGEGPTKDQRRGSVTVAVARVLDGVGRELSRVQVEGPSPYDLTAELLAWAAAMLVTGRAQGIGALGPADAFGLPALVAGCADMGLRRLD
jgi:hypothetical protein